MLAEVTWYQQEEIGLDLDIAVSLGPQSRCKRTCRIDLE